MLNLIDRDSPHPVQGAVHSQQKSLPAKRANRTAFLNMIDNPDDIERDALDMIDRFGHAAVCLARELAETAEERRSRSAQAWHDIADAIDRLSLKL